MNEQRQQRLEAIGKRLSELAGERADTASRLGELGLERSRLERERAEICNEQYQETRPDQHPA